MHVLHFCICAGKKKKAGINHRYSSIALGKPAAHHIFPLGQENSRDLSSCLSQG